MFFLPDDIVGTCYALWKQVFKRQDSQTLLFIAASLIESMNAAIEQIRADDLAWYKSHV